MCQQILLENGSDLTQPHTQQEGAFEDTQITPNQSASAEWLHGHCVTYQGAFLAYQGNGAAV